MAPPTIRLEANHSEAWKCLIKAFLLRIETAVVDDSVLQCLKEEAKQEAIVFCTIVSLLPSNTFRV